MAKLPDNTLSTIFKLQRQLLERIDETTGTEFALFELYGETEEIINYYEQLQNARERADAYYVLFTTLRQIYPSQGAASRDSLELLTRFIAEAEATVNAVEATISEIKRDFNLL